MPANMDRQSWQKIEALFHEALELPSNQRSGYLEAQSVTNEIRSQVKSLLASLDDGDDYLEQQSQSFSGVIQQAVLDLAGQWNPGSDSAARVSHPSSAILGDSSHDSDRGLNELLQRKREQALPQAIDDWAKHVPGYELRRLISRGGMGTVFAAWDPTLQRHVAIKIIAGKQIDGRVYRQFIRESSAAAKLNSDHVVTIHAVGDQADFPFLVMELIEGPSLKQWISEKGAIPAREAAEVICQAAVGLSHAHEAQLIHRDVKPANILLVPTPRNEFAWRAKLIDFGLARSLDRDQWESSDQLIAGTPAYMSPEQLTHPDQVDQRADIYGLGATLYQLLTGIPPFQGATVELLRRIQFEEPVAPRRLNRDIPIDLNSICLKAMCKEPSGRYATALELAEDLRRFLAGESTKARPVSGLRWMVRWVRRYPRTAAINAALVIAVFVLIAGGLITANVLSVKNRQLAEQEMAQWTAAVKRIADANPGALPLAIESVDLSQTEIISQLQEILDNIVYDRQAKVNAAIALAHSDQPAIEPVLEATYQSFRSPWQCQNLIAALQRISGLNDAHWQEVIARMEAADMGSQDLQDAVARVAIVAAAVGHPKYMSQLCKLDASDPQRRTTVIHLLPEFHPSCFQVSEFLRRETDSNILYAYGCGLALMKPLEYSVLERMEIQRSLQALIAATEDAGVLAAAASAIRVWGGRAVMPEAADYGRAFWAGPDDLWLVRIESGRQRLGRLNPDVMYEGYPPHDVTLTRPFYLADREINWRQFKLFLQDATVSDDDKPVNWRESFANRLATAEFDELPATEVSWIDAVLFCNWLSQRCQLRPVYRRLSTKWKWSSRNDPNEIREVNGFEWDREADGFRLPTEAEWEFACRAGSETDYHFGNDESLISSYVNVSNFRRKPLVPGRSLLPNRFGIHEMHGNVWEWCFDWHQNLGQEPLVDPYGPEPDESTAVENEPSETTSIPGSSSDKLQSNISMEKIYRGGGVALSSGDSGSGARGRTHPDSRFGNLGFRIAR